MQMSLKSNKKYNHQIELDFEDIEANVMSNHNQVSQISLLNKNQLGKEQNSNFKSDLTDYSKLNPDLMKQLLDFEDDDVGPGPEKPSSYGLIHAQKSSQKSQSSKITFQLSDTTEINDVASPPNIHQGSSKVENSHSATGDMNALAELCQIDKPQADSVKSRLQQKYGQKLQTIEPKPQSQPQLQPPGSKDRIIVNSKQQELLKQMFADQTDQINKDLTKSNSN